MSDLDEADATVRVRFVVNGRKTACDVAPRDTLVDACALSSNSPARMPAARWALAAPVWSSSMAAPSMLA